MPDVPPQRTALRIGTRGSKLAQWQAEWVAEQLRQSGREVAVVEIATQGDRDADSSLRSFSGVGVFTKEIQRALLSGEVDVAVHSLKDLPTDVVPGLILAAVPPREDVHDVLVSREGVRLGELSRGALIGTGSLRRQAQLRNLRSDLQVAEVRGNVDTRLQKLVEGSFDALVLAQAGLSRLRLAERITEVLPLTTMLPAVGQGALGIECRADDAATRADLARLDDANTRAAVGAERALLAHLRGGCLAPVGAWGRVAAGQLMLTAVVLSPDGRERLDARDAANPADAAALGTRVAEVLLSQGAARLIAVARGRR